jgi:starvation-inducible DNA-binding protein
MRATAPHQTDTLNGVLADATVFYQKLRSYHWTVTGRQFFALHEQFERMYTAWAGIVDAIAERIMSTGGRPLTTLREVLEAALLLEADASANAERMVQDIAEDLEALIARMRSVLEAAEERGDRGTVALLDEMCAAQEKQLWMLRAWLGEA